jgi:hypothetical protein
MIEKFNFFDVYAYFLPGAALLGLFWLPLGIINGSWPPTEISSALLFLVAAYIAGHVLYRPSKDALPTETTGRYDSIEKQRTTPSHPSDFVLDADERTFPIEFKRALQDAINARFKHKGLKGTDLPAVQVNVDFDWKTANDQAREDEIRKRDLAFFLCRSALVEGEAASYGEQFEGLYQLLRALTVIFALGCAYHLGWTLAIWKMTVDWRLASGVLAGIAIICAAAIDSWGWKIIKDKKRDTKEQKDKRKRLRAQIVIGLLLLTLFLCPFSLKCVLNAPKLPGGCRAALLMGAVLADLFVSLRSLSAYKHFANEFAKAIYRDFYVFATSGATPTK